MDYISALKKWNKAKEYLDKIYDPKTRKLYHDALLLRAIDEWGFNPEKIDKVNTPKIELTDWEKELLNDMQAAQEYGIDTRKEKRKQTDKEFRLAMLDFIKSGGLLSDIPENLRKEKAIKDAYWEISEKYYNFI